MLPPQDWAFVDEGKAGHPKLGFRTTLPSSSMVLQASPTKLGVPVIHICQTVCPIMHRHIPAAPGSLSVKLYLFGSCRQTLGQRTKTLRATSCWRSATWSAMRTWGASQLRACPAASARACTTSAARTRRTQVSTSSSTLQQHSIRNAA